MEPLNATDVREQLAMVDRILAESSQRLCFGADFFLVWGVYSGIATLAVQLVVNHVVPGWAIFAPLVLLVPAIAFSIVRGRQLEREHLRRSIVQREFFNVLWLTLGLAFVLNLGAFNLLSGWGSATIWSFAESVVLFFIGTHGNRRAILAGLLVVVSVVVANFMPPASAGYVLAAGMIAGYGGFGLVEMLARG